MEYVASQYNYATPLSSVAGLASDSSVVFDKKYFTLFDNTLDGSYMPISGDVGLWGNSLSDASGVLTEPFEVTFTEDATIASLHITGSQYSFPVDFTVSFYNEDTLLHTISVTDNTLPECFVYSPQVLTITHFVVTVTRISQPNAVARLYNVNDSGYYINSDELFAKLLESSKTAGVYHGSDVAKITAQSPTAQLTNYIKVEDVLTAHIDSTPRLINVHTRMKEPYRRIYGKVYITYTDPMLDNETAVLTNSIAYNSTKEQLLDASTLVRYAYFALYDNDLTGRCPVSDKDSQVGWVSGAISNADGRFDVEPYVTVTFDARPITGLTLYFDSSRNNPIEDCTVTLANVEGKTFSYNVVGNTESSVQIITEPLADITTITVRVHKVALPFSPAVITEIPIGSTILYRGYDDVSDIMSIDLLEELTYEDDIEALGGVSANEITVVLDNSNQDFYFNNADSLVAKQLKRNRKIEPWLGVEIVEGEIEWYSLGVFWSYKWDVPMKSLTATVVGFDTIGLLSISDFINHQVQINKSIGELIEYVLADARNTFSFIEYTIDPALYDIIIPYAWFEASNHAAALRKISMCYPMHIYCDRQGRICAAPQKLKLDFFYDTWSDNTNVIDKSYSSLYTVLPNIVNVTVKYMHVQDNYNILQDDTAFNVDGTEDKTLVFNEPYLDNLIVSVDCDSTITYTYSAYAWGLILRFVGTGTVRSISCIGTIVDVSHSSVMTKRDAESVRVNGAVTREVVSDFIQTDALASTIIDRLFSLSEDDKYDAQVNYRGDIALSINDPIKLLDGLAPDNRYNIRRHQLSWNGSLTGSADLNT